MSLLFSLQSKIKASASIWVLLVPQSTNMIYLNKMEVCFYVVIVSGASKHVLLYFDLFFVLRGIICLCPPYLMLSD